MSKFKKIIFFLLIAGSINNTYSQNFSKRKINNLKTQVSQMVEDDKKMTQVMIDKVFSFGELGFQEFLLQIFTLQNFKRHSDDCIL